jgi:hypothetical protein
VPPPRDSGRRVEWNGEKKRIAYTRRKIFDGQNYCCIVHCKTKRKGGSVDYIDSLGAGFIYFLSFFGCEDVGTHNHPGVLPWLTGWPKIGDGT